MEILSSIDLQSLSDPHVTLTARACLPTCKSCQWLKSSSWGPSAKKRALHSKVGLDLATDLPSGVGGGVVVHIQVGALEGGDERGGDG